MVAHRLVSATAHSHPESRVRDSEPSLGVSLRKYPSRAGDDLLILNEIDAKIKGAISTLAMSGCRSHFGGPMPEKG
jgi:hypothetical protein